MHPLFFPEDVNDHHSCEGKSLEYRGFQALWIPGFHFSPLTMMAFLALEK